MWAFPTRLLTSSKQDGLIQRNIIRSDTSHHCWPSLLVSSRSCPHSRVGDHTKVQRWVPLLHSLRHHLFLATKSTNSWKTFVFQVQQISKQNKWKWAKPICYWNLIATLRKCLVICEIDYHNSMKERVEIGVRLLGTSFVAYLSFLTG